MSARKYPEDFVNKIICGDCLEVMRGMPENSADAIVCDPPYGLEFMGKKWDKLWDKREFGINEYSKKSYTGSDGSTRKTNPVSRKLSNPNYKAGIEAQLWHTQWLTEAYQVLKPGGSMLVMGGTRTSHRLACAIEDTGFIIKDTLMWLYGSGFPKAQDLGKMIDKRMGKEREVIGIKKHSDNFDNAKTNKVGYLADPANKNNEKCFGYGKEEISIPSTDLAKHWNGFKIGGIKPAYEPIIWAVKPPEGSYVDNILRWNVGAVNVNECRISLDIDNELNYNNKHETSENQNILSSVSSRISNTHKPSLENEKSNMWSSMQKHNDERGKQLALERRNVLQQRRLQIHPDRKRLSNGAQDNNGKSFEEEIKVTGNCSSYQRNKDRQQDRKPKALQKSRETHFTESCNNRQKDQEIQKPLGRFPANIILSHHPDCVQVGMKKIRGVQESAGSIGFGSGRNDGYKKGLGRQYKKDEQIESWDCHPDCAVRILDEQSGILKSGHRKRILDRPKHTNVAYGKFNINAPNESLASSGGASRFFYCAKASKSERGKNNKHPTVKPIALFMWLIQLVTREGQVILDPFIGSGTTMLASQGCNRKCIGIEKEPEYCKIAEERLAQGVL